MSGERHLCIAASPAVAPVQDCEESVEAEQHANREQDESGD
jgi:hypothetical protein